MEAKVERHARIGAHVREGAVQSLAIADRDVAGRTDHRNGVGQTLRASGPGERGDVHLAAMRAGHNPEPIRGVAAVELRHEVEAVGVLAERGALPVRPAILVPGDRAAEAGVLDPDRLVEGREVRAVDRLGHRQELRVAVETQTGFRELERAEHELEHVGGGAGGPARLEHLHRVAAVGGSGPAERVGEGLDPAQVARDTAAAERRPPLAVELRVLRHRRPFQELVHVALEVGELVLAEQALEDVEAAARVRRPNLGSQRAARVEAQRPAIAEAECPRGALRAVARHRRLFVAVIALEHRRCQPAQSHSLASASSKHGTVPSTRSRSSSSSSASERASKRPSTSRVC